MENKNLGERSSFELMSLASRIQAIHHAMTAEELAELLKVSRLTILGRGNRPSACIGHALMCVGSHSIRPRRECNG